MLWFGIYRISGLHDQTPEAQAIMHMLVLARVYPPASLGTWQTLPLPLVQGSLPSDTGA